MARPVQTLCRCPIVEHPLLCKAYTLDPSPQTAIMCPPSAQEALRGRYAKHPAGDALSTSTDLGRAACRTRARGIAKSPATRTGTDPRMSRQFHIIITGEGYDMAAAHKRSSCLLIKTLLLSP